jgi:hypothetical protein
MIKYIEFDSIDDYGQHITPIDRRVSLTKTASAYSPELMKVILNMKRRPDRYYVVVNALGSMEYWGANRNGDAFPEEGLKHVSLRTDMGTPNDYGYKTFEYYARLYRHHVNKDPNNSFGEIVFSHWNAPLHRVELIIAVNVDNSQDIIDAVEKAELISVSMGCKVRYDKCNICGNKARTREEYCNHLKNHLGEIVNKDTAQKWSIELGRTIMPGTQVCAINDFPRFFDLSKVHVGADRISYVLGKAASKMKTISSIDVAEAMGVTDSMIDKLSTVGKEADIDKEVGALGPDDMDGSMVKAKEVDAIRKAMNERMNRTIVAEPQLPTDVLNASASSLPLRTIFSTLFGLGIQPKPVEIQRIILVRIGQQPLADELESSGIILPMDQDNVAPMPIDISNANFSDTLGRILSQNLESRSSFPSFLCPRMMQGKFAAQSPQQNLQAMTAAQLLGIEKKPMVNPASVTMGSMGAIAALYMALKMKALGYGPAQLAEIFMSKPWLRTLVGGGAISQIYAQMDKNKSDSAVFAPANVYQGMLQNGVLGQVKTAGENAMIQSIIYPSIYTLNAWEQKPMCDRGNINFGMIKTSSDMRSITMKIEKALSSLRNILPQVL